MQAPPSSPGQCASVILDSLPCVMQRLRQLMRDVRGNLTVPQFRLLAFLDRQPGSTLAEVADFIGIAKATASTMVTTLERKGFIKRMPTLDRRTVALHASRKGKTLLGHAYSAARTRVAERLASLDEPSLAGLERAFLALSGCFADSFTAEPREK